MVHQGYNPSLHWSADSAPSFSPSRFSGQGLDLRTQHVLTVEHSCQTPQRPHRSHTHPSPRFEWVDRRCAHSTWFSKDTLLSKSLLSPHLHLFLHPPSNGKEKSRNPRNWHSDFPLNLAMCTFAAFFLWGLCLSPGFAEAAVSGSRAWGPMA